MDRLSKDKFDEMLGWALKKHSEPVPAGFTDRVLRLIEEAEEWEISARPVNEGELDGILRHALRRHPEAVPADFTARMLRQIRETEEKKILAQVVMKERLALAGCIGLGVVAVVVAAVFPSVAAGLIEQAKAFIIGIGQSIKAADYQWQSCAIFVGMFGIAVYALVDMLASDS